MNPEVQSKRGTHTLQLIHRYKPETSSTQNAHSSEVTMAIAGTRHWGYLTSVGENTHQCRQTLVLGEYTSAGKLPIVVDAVVYSTFGGISR